MAERAADHGETDTGIAGRALDNHAARLERAVGDRLADDIERRAVLHGTARIEEFGLAEDFTAGRIGRAIEPDQRRLADQVEHMLGRHGVCPFLKSVYSAAIRAGVWIPHSVLAWPSQRPERISPSLWTGAVQVQQPIEAYPISVSGCRGKSKRWK